MDALTYVPIPPFHSRSTGAVTMARIISVGVRDVTCSPRPSLARTGEVTGIALALRGYTPPPSLISSLR